MNFKEMVQLVTEASKSKLDVELSELRAEGVVETLKDWSQIDSDESIKTWFKGCQESCSLEYEDIPISECKGWSLNESSGFIEHKSGEFFYIQGLRVTSTNDREVKTGWDQPIITQVGFNGGILGLIRCKKNEIPYYLVEAKAEPGNPDKVQISPTLQATFSNLKQAHGGSKPRFAEYFESSNSTQREILFDQWFSEDGGRLHLKRNRGMLVEVEDIDTSLLTPNFRWLTLYQIKKLIKENSWVSPHLRSLISHL